MSRLEKAKDAIDLALGSGRSTSKNALNRRLASARDLIEYIELHYVSTLEIDLEKRRRVGAFQLSARGSK